MIAMEARVNVVAEDVQVATPCRHGPTRQQSRQISGYVWNFAFSGDRRQSETLRRRELHQALCELPVGQMTSVHFEILDAGDRHGLSPRGTVETVN